MPNPLHVDCIGDALRNVQENLDAKNYYAFNPEFDVQRLPDPRLRAKI
nr:hypothetical protein [uncultured Butyricicoccus sp.]